MIMFSSFSVGFGSFGVHAHSRRLQYLRSLF
jgi:hypothetical protein